MRRFLARIRESLGRPITKQRLGYWLSHVGGFFLGETLRCPQCGKKYQRTFPVIFRGKLYLLGLHGDFVRPVFDSQYRLGFECLDCFARTSASLRQVTEKVPASKPPAVRHLVLGHQPPGAIEPILSYFQKLEPGMPVSLVYGGTPENFDQVRWPDKVFCPDPHLRGPTSGQYHRGLFDTLARMTAASSDDDWILYTEADCLPVQRRYAQKIIALVENRGADFAATNLYDVTGSNAHWYQREIKKEGWLDVVARHTVRDDPARVYHCLACLMLFRACFLRRWLEFPHPQTQVYCEIYLPTLAYHLGLEIANLSDVAHQFDYCRYRPELLPDDLPGALNNGALFIHPAKWIPSDLPELPA